MRGKTTPYRMMHKFWLDLRDDIESELIEAIAALKAQRLFTAYIRDGLRLMLSLSRGDTSVLRTLFPGVVRQIEESYHAGELERLNKRLDELTAYIQDRGMPLPAPKMVVERVTAPSDQPNIVVTKAKGGSAGANFMAQMKQFANKGVAK